MNTRSFVLLAALVVPSLAIANPASLSARVFDGVGLSIGTEPSSTFAVPEAAAFHFDSLSLDDEFRIDDGGGLSSDTRQILSLVLGIIPGFGLGHLIARDRDGFVLFLIIDVAIAVVGGGLGWALKAPGLLWGLGGILVLVERIIEGLDAYASAGGERFIEVTRERSISFASVANPLSQIPVTTRVFDLRF